MLVHEPNLVQDAERGDERFFPGEFKEREKKPLESVIGAAQRHGVDELTQESIQCTLAAAKQASPKKETPKKMRCVQA